MKHAVKNMREQHPNDLVVAFFFHGQGVDLQKTPLGLFRALLNFLLEYSPDYLTQLTMKFEEREKRYGAYTADRWKWIDKELQEMFFGLLTKGTQHQPVVIFVDALDECGEVLARSLLVYFRDIIKQAEREKGQVKVCLSSRHYPILSLDSVPAVFVEERNDGDILWYTQERLKDIQPKIKRKQIEGEILSKAKGGFQWVFLVTGTIIDKNLAGIRAEKLLEELQSCPQTLGELYAAILTSVQEAERRQMAKIFQWVLFAKRPLSAQELRDALATDKDMTYTSVCDLRAHEGWSDTLADFERYVKYISRGLIQFQSREFWEQYVPYEDSDREAQLIHQSVADYLLDGFFNNVRCDRDDFRSQIAAGQFQISRSCLKYMTLREILEDTQLPRGTLSSKFPLAPYIVRFLFEHIQSVEQEGIVQSDLLTVLQWTPKSKTMQKLASVWSTLDPDSGHTPIGWPFVEATAMHVLATLGSRSAVVSFLEANDEVDDRDSDGNTPLMLAIREGHQDIALALLAWSADGNHPQEEKEPINDQRGSVTQAMSRLLDVNAANKDGDTVLNIALDQKAGNVILKLIEAGADLKYMGRETELVRHTISSGNMPLLAKLIEKNINLDGAVYFALKNHSPQQDYALEDLIEELLKAGANTNRLLDLERVANDEYSYEDEDDHDHDHDHDDDESQFDDSLILASRRGLINVVNLLLSNGASASFCDKFGRTPLMFATQNEHKEVMQSLLENAPSMVEMEDEEGYTALNIACEIGRLDLTTLLIEEGTFSAPNPVLEEFFLYMIKIGEKSVVEAALRKDIANPGSLDTDNRTTVSWAAGEGHDAIVKLLIDTGKVDADLADDSKRTPLSHAAEKGHQAVVKLLLDTGKVEADAKDDKGWTPFLHAAQNGHEAIVKLLLDKININVTNNAGPTPLLWAAEKGHQAVVKLLLDTAKVDADVKNKAGWTPLLYAVQNGSEAIVKLLLDTGKVDANVKDDKGWTPLLLAVRNRYEDVAKLLLDTGKIDADAKDYEGRTSLLLAVQNGDEAIVELLLDTGKVDVSAKNDQGRTSLLLAVQNGYKAIVKLLLDTGKVDTDIKDNKGRTSLLLAVQNRNEAIIKLLLETGKVDVNVKNSKGRTSILLALQNRDKAITKLLLETGKVDDVNVKNDKGSTPLLLAARNGYEVIAKLLLDRGKADFNAKNNKGLTPLSLAVRNGHDAIVKLLLETGKVDTDAKDNEGWTPLSLAVQNGRKAILKLLLNKGKVDINVKNNAGSTPLLLAVQNGREALVKLLLGTGRVNADAKDYAGWTPLSRAAQKGHEAIVKLLLDKVDADAKDDKGRTPLLHAVHNGHEAIAKLLLDTGKVDADVKDDKGWTPLLHAVHNGHKAIVKLLLDIGKVDTNVKDNKRWTPLLYAAKNGREAIVKLLLELDTGKVDADAKDYIGWTPLSLAAQNGSETIVKLLLDTGKVDINARDYMGWAPLSWAAQNGREAIVKLLLDTSKVDVNAKNNIGSTPLSLAVQNGYEAIVNLLLNIDKVDVDIKNNAGSTPLLLAVQNGREALVKLLLGTGRVDTDAKDYAGWTPLSWAAQIGHYTIVKLLLDTGKVDINARDYAGWTPLSWAVQNGREAIVKLLLDTSKVDVNAKNNAL